MNEQEFEQTLDRGNRAAWTEMLRICIKNLAYDDPASRAAIWILEREAAIVMLRQVCAEHGDNDWRVDLNLSDIIEKHLWRNLGIDK